jgi:hypothetical protein
MVGAACKIQGATVWYQHGNLLILYLQVRLYFVVPHHLFESFKQQPYTRGKDAVKGKKARKGKVAAKPLEPKRPVRQYALKLNLAARPQVPVTKRSAGRLRVPGCKLMLA